MSETLGSLCDKLTIIKLKQFHAKDEKRSSSLLKQEKQLVDEIDAYVKDAVNGRIPTEKLKFASNKIFKSEKNEIREFNGSFGEIFSELSKINCELWHEQEKVYEFDKVPCDEKDRVVKNLGVLNLERNRCIDELNSNLYKLVENK